MPGREIPLVSGQIYHVFNRGVASQPIFNTKRDYKRFLEIWLYYRNVHVPIRYSKFITLSTEIRSQILKGLNEKRIFNVDCLCYCLMPNHFHFVLRQLKDGGISQFVSKATNSYSKYFNTKNERSGPLLQGKFKAVRIETDEQLLHVSRYIHLNPYTAFMIKSYQEIINYPFSSLREYLGLEQGHNVEAKEVLNNFKNIQQFKEFVFDQADYQRRLGLIGHLILEK